MRNDARLSFVLNEERIGLTDGGLLTGPTLLPIIGLVLLGAISAGCGPPR